MGNHRAGPNPSTFLVEPRGSFVSDGATKPRRLNTALCQPSLCIRNQCGGKHQASELGGDEELIQLAALNDAKANRLVKRADGPHIWQSCLKPVSKALQRTKRSSFRRHKSG